MSVHDASYAPLQFTRLPPARPTVTRRRLSDRPAAHLRNVLDRTIALAFGVDPHLIGMSSRGRADIARARQVGMYLAHVVGGLTLTNVGELYERDRTTVSHACQIVEDLREDDDFDQAILHLECALVIMLQSIDMTTGSKTARRMM